MLFLTLLKPDQFSFTKSLLLAVMFMFESSIGRSLAPSRRSLSPRGDATFNLDFEDNEGVIVRPKLREINRRSSHLTERDFKEIHNPSQGYQWSTLRTGGYDRVNAVLDDDQHQWIICGREGVFMIGLNSGPWPEHLYRFVGKFGPYIRLDPKLRLCSVDPTETDSRLFFRFLNFPFNRRNVIQHIQSRQYVKLYRKNLRGYLEFTSSLQEATDWSLRPIRN